MRELTKSMLSFSWAMPLYGMKQMLNMTMPRDMSRPFAEATEGFQTVTGSMREQLGSTMRSMFDAGDQIQRGLVDVMYSFGFGAFDPNALMRMGSDAMQRSMPGMTGMPGMPGMTGDTGFSATAAGQGSTMGTMNPEYSSAVPGQAVTDYGNVAALGQPSASPSRRNR